MSESSLPLPLPLRQTLENHARRLPEVDVNAVETYLLLLRTTNDLGAGLRTNLARYGLSDGKFRLLVLLLEEIEDEGREPTPSQLAERAGLPRATVTGLLDGLEQAGLIRREDDPSDRRGLIIRLTEAGRELLDRHLPDHFGRVARLMAGLTDSEQQQLRDLLRKVREHLPDFSAP